MPNDPYYRSKEWRNLRARVLIRDLYRCAVPGCTDVATTVDHIKRRQDGGTEDLSNLRSLCSLHDKQVKESSTGKRFNDGKFKLIGCGADGWPIARQ